MPDNSNPQKPFVSNSAPASKKVDPAARPQPELVKKTQKGAPAGKASVKPGVKVPLKDLLKKIPLPYLGGGAAFLAMVLFVVVKAAMTPLPVPQQVAAAAQQAAPASQQAAVSATETTATASPTNASENQGTAAVPAYVGPQEPFGVAPVADELPLVNRIGDGLKELGREVKMTRQEFDQKTQVFSANDLGGDPFLAYQVRVPLGWRSMGQNELQGTQLNNRLMGVMAYYVSPADLELRSSLQIKAQRMTHMMSARDWVLNHALANHYTLQALSTYGDDRVEAVYVMTEADISYVVRLVSIVSGPRVVLAEYFVPMQKYEEEKDIQTWGITSFYLKKRDLTSIEPEKTMYFFDIASVSYPESWMLQDPDIVSVDQMSASVVNLQQERKDKATLLRGRVDVLLFAKSEDFTELMVIDTMNRTFETQGLKLGKKVGRFLPIKNKNNLSGKNYTIYEIDSLEGIMYQTYQYWVEVLEGKNYYFYICLLTPPRDADIYNWSRNLGAFEYMIKTVKEGV